MRVGARAALFLLLMAGCGGGGLPGGGGDGRVYSPNYVSSLGGRFARWPAGVIDVSVVRGAESRPAGELVRLVQEAARRWNDVAGGVELRVRDDGTTEGARVVLCFVSPDDPDVEGSIVGLTTRRFREASPIDQMTSASVKVESGLAREQLLATLTHELGHALGIGGHSDRAEDVMAPAPIPPGAVSQSDANTLRTILSGGAGRAAGVTEEETIRCAVYP